MSTSFALAGSFDYPPDTGQPVSKRPFSQSGTYVSKAEHDLVLTGAGTHDVGFGTVTAVKAMSIEVAPTSLAPVTIEVNGGNDDIEIAPGGFLVYSNPAPNAAIEELSIVYTQDVQLQIRLLG